MFTYFRIQVRGRKYGYNFGKVNSGVRGNAKTIRKYLWDINKRCFWCNTETELGDLNFIKDKQQRNMTATIDHYYSRNNKNRNQLTRDIVVLSCLRCNQDRGNNGL